MGYIAHSMVVLGIQIAQFETTLAIRWNSLTEVSLTRKGA